MIFVQLNDDLAAVAIRILNLVDEVGQLRRRRGLAGVTELAARTRIIKTFPAILEQVLRAISAVGVFVAWVRATRNLMWTRR